MFADVGNASLHGFALIERIGLAVGQPAFRALPRQYLTLAFLFEETPQYTHAVVHRQNLFDFVIVQE
jgi:hypothetical protein